MVHRSLLALLFVLLPAAFCRLPGAQAAVSSMGIYRRADCTTIHAPVVGKTFCFDATANRLKIWTGSRWVQPFDGIIFASDFGARFDAKRVTDGVMTATSNVLTSPTARFKKADVDKTVDVAGAGVAGTHLLTRIAGYTSPTRVTLAAAASRTVNNAVVVYGSDDTTGIQNALNTLAVGTEVGNLRIIMPAGLSIISATLIPPNSASHFSLEGACMFCTQLWWLGTTSSPMIKATNAHSVSLRNFALRGYETRPPSHGIQIHKAAGQVGHWAPQRVEVQNVMVGNLYGEWVDTCLAFTAETGQDANNENALILNPYFHCTTYGISVEHSNSLLHRVFAGSIYGGSAAINTVSGAAADGSLSLYGVTLGSTTNGHLFRLGRGRHVVSVVEGTAESTQSGTGFLTTPSSIGTGSVISVIGGSYQLGDPGAGDAASTIFFDATSGRLEMMGVNLATPNGARFRFPSTGSQVDIRGGQHILTTLQFNNEVRVDGAFNSNCCATITNLGSGTLRVKDGTGGFAEPRDLGDTASPNVDGWNQYETQGRMTITSFTGGSPGQEVTIYSQNTRVIQQGGNIRMVDGQNRTLVPGAMIKLRKSSAPYGGRWYEVANTPTRAHYFLNLPVLGSVPGCVDSAEQPLTGAAFGDTVNASVDIALPAAQQLTAFVSSAGKITFRVCQLSEAAADPDGSGATYRADLWKR